MDVISLSDRLALIASFVPRGARVADVGCDHGYIPVYLAQTGTAATITATDIKSGPLEAARRSAEKYGVAGAIDFIKCDGLSGAGRDFDTVIIAGMGGETIESIIERAPWLKSSGTLLILQPQTKIAELTNYLDNSGYAIEDAALARDGEHIYVVMTVRAGHSRSPFTCAEMYADRLLMEKRDPLLPQYLGGLIAKTRRALEGMERATSVRADELTRLRLALDGFIKMKKETELWQA